MKALWKKCLCIGATLFLLFLCINYWDSAAGLITGIFSAAMPLIIGCIIAYLVNIPMSFYEKHFFPKMRSKEIAAIRKVVCILAAYLTFAATVALLTVIIVPELIDCITLLGSMLIDWFKTVDTTKLADILPEELIDSLKSVDWRSVFGKVFSFLSSGIGGITSTVVAFVSKFVSGAVSSAVGLIFSVYLLAGKTTLKDQINRLIKNYMKPKWRERVTYVVSTLNDSFRCYFVGQCVEAVILGVLCAIGMFTFRMPYAAMIGTLVGFTALIPVVGAYIGASIGAFMILTVSPLKAVWFLIFIIILQQIEGNLIYPRVVGSSVGLPGIWVLAAVTVGGGLFGVLGMFITVPLSAALYRMLREDMNKREENALRK